MNLRSFVPAFPRSSIVVATALCALGMLVCVFLIGRGDWSDPVVWACSVAFLLLFIGFYLFLWGLLMLVPSLRRPWVNPKQAMVLGGGGFILQAGLAGMFTMLGMWPHPESWYLGALAFAWG